MKADNAFQSHRLLAWFRLIVLYASVAVLVLIILRPPHARVEEVWDTTITPPLLVSTTATTIDWPLGDLLPSTPAFLLPFHAYNDTAFVSMPRHLDTWICLDPVRLGVKLLLLGASTGLLLFLIGKMKKMSASGDLRWIDANIVRWSHWLLLATIGFRFVVGWLLLVTILFPPAIYRYRVRDRTAVPPIVLSESYTYKSWGPVDEWLPGIPPTWMPFWTGATYGSGSLARYRESTSGTDFLRLAEKLLLQGGLICITFPLSRRLRSRIAMADSGFEVLPSVK